MGCPWHRHYVAGYVCTFVVGILGTILAVHRTRRERTLATVRSVAETAQRVLLRPVPRRLGQVSVESLYPSAAAEARIGDDLYETVPTARGVRLLIGDVRGKELVAVETVAAMLSAFREAAPDARSGPADGAELGVSPAEAGGFTPHGLSFLPHRQQPTRTNGEHWCTGHRPCAGSTDLTSRRPGGRPGRLDSRRPGDSEPTTRPEAMAAGRRTALTAIRPSPPCPAGVRLSPASGRYPHPALKTGLPRRRSGETRP